MTVPGDSRALAAQFENLGLTAGSTVLVQASMRKVAPDSGDASTVLKALLDVLGCDGTVVVPTYTSWNSKSSKTYRDAVADLSPHQADAYLRSLPAFDPRTTPSSGMGELAEAVRTYPGAYRSTHPQTSFAAVGRRARVITAIHDLTCHLGPRSPLGALYESAALVLLLGVGYNVCTAFHLAEYRYGPRPKRPYECRVAGWPGDGWTSFDDIELDDSQFGLIGKEFEAAQTASDRATLRIGTVGRAETRLFALQDAVDFTQSWMLQFAS